MNGGTYDLDNIRDRCYFLFVVDKSNLSVEYELFLCACCVV
jgi:hypothetical protein